MFNQPTIRASRPDDVNLLPDIDLKCYDYPDGLGEWKEFFNRPKDNKTLLIHVGKRLVGLGAWCNTINQETGDVTASVRKLCIVPAFRRRGFGTKLLTSLESHAAKDRNEVLRIIVPDVHCDPRDPHDVSGFLNRGGFTPNGIVPDWEFMFGRMADGYIWEKKIATL